jgi:2-phospho-L-lactate guanylyltransferase (CobY/MobA/RfbA family)
MAAPCAPNLPDKIVVASVEPGFYGQASIAAEARDGRATRNIQVISTTLDVIPAGIDEIALLNLDLKGAESKALRGAADSIRRIRSVIFDSWKNDGGEAASFLRKLGLQVSQIDGRDFRARRGAREPRG